MTSNDDRRHDEAVINRTIETAIRLGVIAFLLFWVFQIVAPFVSPVLWGVIIAVAAYPAYRALLERMGHRSYWAAGTFTVLALMVLIVPTVWLTEAVVTWGQEIAAEIGDGRLEVPPPPESVAQWPIVGERLHRAWALAAENLGEAATRVEPQLQAIGAWLIKSAASAGAGVLHFVLSILIAGVVLANSEAGADFIRRLFVRLAPSTGVRFVTLAERTVRGVATGVIGVAIIQTVLAAIGFVVAGVPAAAFLAALCLLVAVVQVPLGIVIVPVIAYVWATDTTLTAVLFTLWSVPVILVDNVLKPILMGRGIEAPMLVIFVGAIGGFMTSGIIGLFTGAVLLVLAFELFRAWLDALDEEISAPRRRIRD